MSLVVAGFSRPHQYYLLKLKADIDFIRAGPAPT